MFWLWLLLPLSWEENRSLEKNVYPLLVSGPQFICKMRCLKLEIAQVPTSFTNWGEKKQSAIASHSVFNFFLSVPKYEGRGRWPNCLGDCLLPSPHTPPSSCLSWCLLVTDICETHKCFKSSLRDSERKADSKFEVLVRVVLWHSWH